MMIRRHPRTIAVAAVGAVVTLAGAACDSNKTGDVAAASNPPSAQPAQIETTPASAPTPAQQVLTSMVTANSDKDFAATVDALKQSVSENGMMILGDLDQAAMLKPTGLDIAGAHTFFVGNPSVGKMFFEQNPAIGTVLPLRMLVWAGSDGKTHVSYFDPKPLFLAVDPMLSDGGQKMSDAAAMIAGAVA